MSDWQQTQLAPAAAATSANAASSAASSSPLLSTPGPHPLPAYLQALGSHISALSSSEVSGTRSSLNPSGVHSSHFLTPLLAAYVARGILLQDEEEAARTGEDAAFPVENVSSSASSSSIPPSQRLAFTPAQRDLLVRRTLHALHQVDSPALETFKMQVAFESSYAQEIQSKRMENFKLDTENQQQLQRVLDLVASGLSTQSQVATLYRAIFKLLLANGCVVNEGNKGGNSGSSSGGDRNVDREIAAALESVFPQSALSSFTLMEVPDQRDQILSLINLVLGIRLFNRQIGKGGAGLEDVPSKASGEVDGLYEAFEKENHSVGAVASHYADVIQLELAAPGTITANRLRLQSELLNRRQYILLLHQLQHEVLESLEAIREARGRIEEVLQELKTLVGMRHSVPKEQVYPLFQQLAVQWRALIQEREMNAVRKHLFHSVLLPYRQSFTSNLLEEDLELVRKAQKEGSFPTNRDEQVNFDDFVETVQGAVSSGDEAEGSSSTALTSYRPVRLVKELTPNFMSLPLEYQGYCAWSIVHHGGLLLPGNPSLGIIRVLGRHYSFSSAAAMRDFVADPERYVEGVVSMSKRHPALIHLLCLQPYIPHADIAELFNLDELMDPSGAGAASNASKGHKMNAGSQTPFYINTTLPDPHYHWNEWELRRQALQLANLTHMKTVSIQTNLSHFRRDNSTQYTLPKQLEDGSMAGKGTQTGVEKSSQVERVYRFHTGLRGHPAPSASAATQAGGAGVPPESQMKVVELRIPSHVEDTTNGNLQISEQEAAKKTQIVRST